MSTSQRINTFLDHFILPWPVRFLSHRFVILLTISLLIPLIVFANNTVLVLGLNSYLNTMGVAVSSIVLLYATLSEVHQAQLAELHEQRAQEDHQHVTEMHTILQKSLAEQTEELETLKEMIAALKGQSYERKDTAPVQDLRELHPRGVARYGKHDTADRMTAKLHRHHGVERVRQAMTGQAGSTPNAAPSQ